MQKFRLGGKVIYAGGEEGVLAHVIFDPSTRHITHIGVRQGLLFGKTYNLPYTTVTGASSEAVTLNIKRADAPGANVTAVAGALLESKSIVENISTSAKGTLLLVAIHPESAELAYLVAHHLKPGQDTLVQEGFVKEIAPRHVAINIPAATFEALPPYRPDSDLQQEVEAVIFDVTPLHVDMKGISAHVLDGVAYLDGNVSSGLRADIVRDQVSGIPGILEVKSNLVGDDRLAADIAMALGRDPRTRDLPIGVYPRLGVVRLSGAVHNGQQKEAAAEIARNMPGVRSVINDLIVNPKADLLRVMSPAEGGEAEDKVPGKYIRHTK